MREFLINNIKVTNNNLFLIVPLIFFISGSIAYVNYIQNIDQNSFFSQAIAYIALFITLGGCFAGWFYIIKKSIYFSHRLVLFEKDNNIKKELLNSFFKGIGRAFLPVLFVVICIFLYNNIIHFILVILLKNLNNTSDYNAFKLGICVINAFIGYWLLFWIPEIIYCEKNPIRALINAIYKSYSSLKFTLHIYLDIIIIYIFAKIIYDICNFNIFLMFISTLFCYYAIYYTIILVFRYYEEKFIR